MMQICLIYFHSNKRKYTCTSGFKLDFFFGGGGSLVQCTSFTDKKQKCPYPKIENIRRIANKLQNMESNFQKLISLFIIQYSMIEAAHLTRQETKELCQQEVQRYIHIPLCTILKTYLFLLQYSYFDVFNYTWKEKFCCGYLIMMFFKNILCIFQT